MFVLVHMHIHVSHMRKEIITPVKSVKKKANSMTFCDTFFSILEFSKGYIMFAFVYLGIQAQFIQVESAKEFLQHQRSLRCKSPH